MSENDAISRISDIPMPDYYLDYYSSLSDETYSIFEHAAAAKSSLADSSGIIEPKIAFDLADRLSQSPIKSHHFSDSNATMKPWMTPAIRRTS